MPFDSTSWYFPIDQNEAFSFEYKVAAAVVVGLATIEFLLYNIGFFYGLFSAARMHGTAGRFFAFGLSLMFSSLRLLFVPMILANVPLPKEIQQFLPSDLVYISVIIAGAGFVLLLILPLGALVYDQITAYRHNNIINTNTAPEILVVVPVYNEDPDVLLAAIIGVVESKYPKNKLNIILAFDEEKVTPLYSKTLQNLDAKTAARHNSISKKSDKPPEIPTVLDVMFRAVRVTLARFPHGGKRMAQAQAFDVIEKRYMGTNAHKDVFILFMDSDVTLDRHAISRCVVDMTAVHPERMAVTGLILASCPRFNLLWWLQDIEYVQGQVMDRCLESYLGAPTCLPGAFTMARLSCLQQVASLYFGHSHLRSLGFFDYCRVYLGEDRYLTHLFMELAQGKQRVGFVGTAYCKTEAPNRYGNLLKQRRRWFLGTLANEVSMLASIDLWQKYPLVLLFRLLNASLRSMSLSIYIVVISLLLQNVPAYFPLALFLGPLILNWLVMIYFAVRLDRSKLALYPFYYIAYPFNQFLFTIYAIVTSASRTWGGPRTVERTESTKPFPVETGEGDIFALYAEPGSPSRRGTSSIAGLSIKSNRRSDRLASMTSWPAQGTASGSRVAPSDSRIPSSTASMVSDATAVPPLVMARIGIPSISTEVQKSPAKPSPNDVRTRLRNAIFLSREEGSFYGESGFSETP